jgi:pimeloyl-ACP methyl ester carboxylesterase
VKIQNPKSEIRIKPQIQNLKLECWPPALFRILDIGIWDLRRISGFGFRAFLCLCVLRAVSSAAPTSAPTSSADFSGHWEGSVQLPGVPLNVRVDLSNTGNAWTGTIDIPQQNATGLTLNPVTVIGSAIRFTIHGVPGDPMFDGKLAGATTIAGTFTQGPLSLPFSLQRGHAATMPVPKPPAQETVGIKPYTEQEVSYSNGPIHLAATLTLPAGNGPFPAVVLITGSGPQNRDEEILGHKPFMLIADHLARAGIAVLRADDRGVGGSTGGTVDEATTVELAGDTLAAIAFLKTQLSISSDRIGLVGHSEGAIIAPMLAAHSKDVAFIVMLAGTGVPGDQVWLKQRELIERADGMPESVIEQENKNAPELLAAIETGAGFAAIDALARSQVGSQAQLLPKENRPTTQQTDANADFVARAMTTRWFRFFLTYDPRPALRQVTVPVLVMNGDLDRQVSSQQNLPEIEKALKEAGNADVTIKLMPGLNHLFQKARTGSPSEYAGLDETFNAGAMDVITSWILGRFGRNAPAPQSR